MKSTLEFTTVKMSIGELGVESSTPDLLGNLNIQNKTAFFLDEEDEIYEGYGKLPNSFPYRQYNCYNREIKEKETKAAILENDYLRAVFLPEYGGRLWSLIDKVAGKNLLYTNDVLRPSNLAVRNAWFSGGVEWNISIIGHSPLTFDRLFTALLSDDKGNPVLRMYEYERVRDVEYQMDFWLGENDHFLNCRMRIVNSTSRMVPMYWWSNMAVPEYEGGRVAVPADYAYTNREDGVHKVAVPMVEGVDISHYNDIPRQVDYFFDIPQEREKYIANLDSNGYGLLHISTNRLRSRKLFSWGKSDGSNRWQEFLTNDAGRYLEIQAGVAKTQYGCLPMAPHTAWEWIEQYGPVNLGQAATELPFSQLCNKVGAIASAELTVQHTERLLCESKQWAKEKATVVHRGSGYGALAQLCREREGENLLSPHLDYGVCQSGQQVWADFLATGKLRELPEDESPEEFTASDLFFDMLQSSVNGDNDHWYGHYQLGIMLLVRGETEKAKKQLQCSRKQKENPWACHGLAVLALMEKRSKAAADAILAGLALRPTELSYIKESFKILVLSGAYKELAAHYEGLSKSLQEETRLKLYYIEALHRMGKNNEAYTLLTAGDGLVVADLREGEDSIGELWSEIHRELFGQEEPVPHQFNFYSL